MTLKCSKCLDVILSYIIGDDDRAGLEVSIKLMQHWEKYHRIEFNKFQGDHGKVIKALSGYLAIATLATVPEDNLYFKKEQTRSLEVVMKMLGYDAADTVDTVDTVDETSSHNGDNGEILGCMCPDEDWNSSGEKCPKCGGIGKDAGGRLHFAPPPPGDNPPSSSVTVREKPKLAIVPK